MRRKRRRVRERPPEGRPKWLLEGGRYRIYSNRLVLLVILAAIICAAITKTVKPASSFLLSSHCLASAPNCTCSWKSGKFVADCSAFALAQVPKNNYFESLLANSGDNQMSTLNRDIQLLNLAQNNLTSLGRHEFARKKYRNLQKLFLQANQLFRIDSSAFYKLTGLVELDLSENLLSRLDESQETNASDLEDDWRKQDDSVELVSAGEKQTSVTETRRWEQAKSDENLSIRKNPSKGFLNHLGQLRQLNLNSNQLTRLDEFEFSSLGQLRQLYLSNNKIKFVNKQAFDGLQMLNTLHLELSKSLDRTTNLVGESSGNRLAHLEARALSKLPQLHGLQLAGETNTWRCDCHLRQLVRALRHQQRPLAGGAQDYGKQAAKLAAPTLKDEPLCSAPELLNAQKPLEAPEDEPNEEVEQHQVQVGESIVIGGATSSKPVDSNRRQQHKQEQPQAPRRLWTNMDLHEFECAPKLVRLESGEPKQSASAWNIEQEARGNDEESGLVANSTQSRNNENIDKQRERQMYLAGEPIRLTCAYELQSDELDLELTLVEWRLQLASERSQARLLWRSAPPIVSTNGSATASQQQQSLDKFAIIDYVTRANASAPGAKKLLRVVHLIVAPESILPLLGGGGAPGEPKVWQRELRFDCLLANAAGRSEFSHTVLVLGRRGAGDQLDSASGQRARHAAYKRRLLRAKWNLFSPLRDLLQPLSAAASVTSATPTTAPMATSNTRDSSALLERAKALVARELARLDLDQERSPGSEESGSPPLFVPLHLQPSELFAARNQQQQPRPADQEQQQAQAQSLARNFARPTLRQAQNGTSSGNSSGAPATAPLELAFAGRSLEAGSLRQLRDTALELVGRFTSNRRDLLELDEKEIDVEDSSLVVIQEDSAEESFDLFRTTLDEDYKRAPLHLVQANTSMLARLRLSASLLWARLRSERPLLVALLVGLIAGCLLSSLLLLRPWWCAAGAAGRRARVADSSGAVKKRRHDDDDEERKSAESPDEQEQGLAEEQPQQQDCEQEERYDQEVTTIGRLAELEARAKAASSLSGSGSGASNYSTGAASNESQRQLIGARAAGTLAWHQHNREQLITSNNAINDLHAQGQYNTLDCAKQRRQRAKRLHFKLQEDDVRFVDSSASSSLFSQKILLHEAQQNLDAAGYHSTASEQKMTDDYYLAMQQASQQQRRRPQLEPGSALTLSGGRQATMAAGGEICLFPGSLLAGHEVVQSSSLSPCSYTMTPTLEQHFLQQNLPLTANRTLTRKSANQKASKKASVTNFLQTNCSSSITSPNVTSTSSNSVSLNNNQDSKFVSAPMSSYDCSPSTSHHHGERRQVCHIEDALKLLETSVLECDTRMGLPKQLKGNRK